MIFTLNLIGGFCLSHLLIQFQFDESIEISVLFALDLLTALSFMIKRTRSQETGQVKNQFLFKGI